MRSARLSVLLVLLVPAAASARQSGAALCAAQQTGGDVALTGASLWADSARRVIDAASIASDLDGLAGARVMLQRAIVAHPKDPWLHYYLGLAYYREATTRLGREGKDQGKLLDAAEAALQASIEAGSTADALGLLGSVVGQKIGNNPIRGMTLGPKSNRLMQEARETSPGNPRLWLMGGIGAIHTPGMFGGGLDKAERELLRAIELFKTDAPKPPLPSWGCAEAWIWLGQVYRQQKKYEDAHRAYQTALSIEPDNAWIKTHLLPSLDRVSR